MVRVVENNDYSEDPFYGSSGLTPDVIGIVAHRSYTPEHNDKKQNNDYIHSLTQRVLEVFVDVFGNRLAILWFQISVKEFIP